ncbi:hypothetical protein [Halomonas ventosae]|uniref:Uncharacterized protein n=1 Tax=Halomonas ventosae TaxID=229007 RepID=A0A2T0VRK2_9GAMM|nr:hypothetical protein [Halomonas ventosae]PRY73177.1 hypothetical protein BCL64_102257 [Halomonas ventosae]
MITELPPTPDYDAWPAIAGAEIDAAGALCVYVAPEDRRLLHARDAVEGASGQRWLQGCYMERDEIRSRYRMVRRARRQWRVAAGA